MRTQNTAVSNIRLYKCYAVMESHDEVVANREEALARRCSLSHCMQHHGGCARAPWPKCAHALVQSATGKAMGMV